MMFLAYLLCISKCIDIFCNQMTLLIVIRHDDAKYLSLSARCDIIIKYCSCTTFFYGNIADQLPRFIVCKNL
jgi:hypothetical protein